MIKAIIPKRPPINLKQLTSLPSIVLNEGTVEAVRLYDETARTWSRPPRPAVDVVDTETRQITIDEDRYRYVDFGTKPHLIRPRRGLFLRFRGGYAAKTQPGVLASGSGGASGALMYARMVRHPGTKARKFSALIAKRVQAVMTDKARALMRAL